MSQLTSAAGYVLRFLIPLVILAMGAMAFVFLGKKQPVPRPPEKIKAVIVEQVPVEVQAQGIFNKGSLDLRTNGTVVPYREIQVFAEVPGKVISVAVSPNDENEPVFDEGNYVDKNTQLLQIEKADFEIEVGRLKQELAGAKSSVEELKVEIENNAELYKISEKELALRTKNVTRLRSLQGTAAATEQELEEAMQLELAASNALRKVLNEGRLLKRRQDRLAANAKLIEFQIKKAELDLERTSVQAPISGTIVETLVEVGSYVTKGQQIAKIRDISKAEVLCALKPSQTTWLWESLRSIDGASPESPESMHVGHFPAGASSIPVRILVEVSETAHYAWQGRLDRYAGTGFDQATQTLPCLIVVDRPQQSQPISRWEVDAFRNGTIGELQETLQSTEEKDEVLLKERYPKMESKELAEKIRERSALRKKVQEERAFLARRAPDRLRQGMYIDAVYISLTPTTTMLRLPERAVRAGDVVLKIEKDPKAKKGAPGKLREVPIHRIQTTRSGDVLIDAAKTTLKPGDRIILSPLGNWYDGMAVAEKKPTTKEKK